jgi:hypothetical protein
MVEEDRQQTMGGADRDIIAQTSEADGRAGAGRGEALWPGWIAAGGDGGVLGNRVVRGGSGACQGRCVVLDAEQAGEPGRIAAGGGGVQGIAGGGRKNGD